jgi:CRP-like cAMP-binding protein
MYRVHAERIFTLEYRSVRERLVAFLLMMAARFGRHTQSGILIDAPMRRQDVASSINASRETIGREFAILERQGLVSSHQTYVTLLNEEGLHKLL